MMQTFSTKRPAPKNSTAPYLCHGFTMVEFMVTAFVFAIGVLGLTALQVATLKYSTTGRSRVTASYIVDQAMQRIQIDGQRFYTMKMNNQTPTADATTPWFNAPGAVIARTYFAGYNKDGVRITPILPTHSTEMLPEDALDALFNDEPDNTSADWMARRTIAFRAFYERTAAQGAAPISTSRTEHFTIRVEYLEDGAQKFLAISRKIRF